MLSTELPSQITIDHDMEASSPVAPDLLESLLATAGELFSQYRDEPF